MPKPLAFIEPAAPTLRPAPPSGPGWIHEIKFDGFRLQLHRAGEDVRLYSRRGHALPRRFNSLAGALLTLPVRSIVLDAELVACDAEDRPDFRALIAGARTDVCAWVFDLLELDGEDWRPRPLVERRKRLKRLLARKRRVLRFSESFDDPIALLAAAGEMRLEGIVSKRADQPYRSGKASGWIKVKTAQWREANRDRGEFFGQKPRKIFQKI